MLARVETAHGTAVLRVMVSERQQPGSLFAPIHWSAREQLGRARSARWCSRTPTPSPASPRPRRRRRACRHCRSAATGSSCRAGLIDTGGFAYWARARMPAGYATFFALDAVPESWSAWSETAAAGRRGPSRTRMHARSSFARPCCAMAGWRPCSMRAPCPVLPSIEWLKTCFDAAGHRGWVCVARCWRVVRSAAPTTDRWCAPASRSGASASRRRSPAAPARPPRSGLATRAGTNCGSCLPEIKSLLGVSAAARYPRRRSRRDARGSTS